MKRILTMIFSFLLVLPLMAQTSIEKVVSEIESKGVDGTVIIKRNPTTKKFISKTRCYNFISKNGNYAEKLIRAFKESSDDAIEYVQSRNNCVAKFTSGSTITSYILNISNSSSQNPRVSLVITSKNKNYRAEIFDFDPGMSIQINPEQKEKLEKYEKSSGHRGTNGNALAIVVRNIPENSRDCVIGTIYTTNKEVSAEVQ